MNNDKITDLIEQINFKERPKSYKKPNKYLAYQHKKLSLSVEAQDIYTLILIQIKKEFDKRYFKISPELIRDDIINSLPTTYTFCIDKLIKIFQISKKVLTKKIPKSKVRADVLNVYNNYVLSYGGSVNLDDKVFIFATAVIELKLAVFMIPNKYDSTGKPIDPINNWDLKSLIDHGSFNGKELSIKIDPVVVYELLQYKFNGGFTEVFLEHFYSVREPYSRKLLELLSQFNYSEIEFNVFEYLASVDHLFDKNNFSQRALAQKAFKRAVEYLIRDTNGYWFVSNDLKDKGVLNGYEFKNLGSNGSFTEKTTVRFLLSRKDIFYSKF
jgi:hypothetical protein